jgi:hypothetical protein
MEGIVAQGHGISWLKPGNTEKTIEFVFKEQQGICPASQQEL